MRLRSAALFLLFILGGPELARRLMPARTLVITAP